MKVSADENRCQGHGLCQLVAPEVFDLKVDDGHVLIRTPDVPPELEEDAARGVDGCPEMALRLEP